MHSIFTPNGRIRRSHFWGYIFILMILELCIGAIIPFQYGVIEIILRKTLGPAFYSVCFWIISCLMIQRLHDLNRPLKHLLYLLVPIYNLYLLFCILFVKGNAESNQYGESPYVANP